MSRIENTAPLSLTLVFLFCCGMAIHSATAAPVVEVRPEIDNLKRSMRELRQQHTKLKDKLKVASVEMEASTTLEAQVEKLINTNAPDAELAEKVRQWGIKICNTLELVLDNIETSGKLQDAFLKFSSQLDWSQLDAEAAIQLDLLGEDIKAATDCLIQMYRGLNQMMGGLKSLHMSLQKRIKKPAAVKSK